jgi:hypothetical protein
MIINTRKEKKWIALNSGHVSKDAAIKYEVQSSLTQLVFQQKNVCIKAYDLGFFSS